MKMRRLSGWTLGAWVCLSAAAGSWGNPALSPQQRIDWIGASYGLTLNPQGHLLYTKIDAVSGGASQRILSPIVSERLLAIFKNLTPEQVDLALAKLLRDFLTPSLGPVETIGGLPLYMKGPQGEVKLSPQGRRILMDLLTAEDGTLLSGGGAAPRPASEGDRPSGLELLRHMQESGVLVRGRTAGTGEFRVARAGAVFDNSAQRRYVVSGYEWDRWGSLPQEEISELAVDQEKNTLRVLIAAHRPVQMDRYLVKNPDLEAEAIYRESGLDPALLARHGARVVRAVDNLIAVDVPLPRVKELGKAAKDPVFQEMAEKVKKEVAYLGLKEFEKWVEGEYQKYVSLGKEVGAK